MSFQKFIAVGYVGGEPEISYLPNGTGKAIVSVATTERWKDKQGIKQEKTSWHRCVYFGNIVDNVIAKYVTKGSLIGVEGTIDYQQWEDKNTGEKKYATQIKAQGLTLLSSANGLSGQQQAAHQQQPVGGDFESDIPFIPRESYP